MKQQNFVGLFLLVVFLEACGGGNGTQVNTTTTPPSPKGGTPIKASSHMPPLEKTKPDTNVEKKDENKDGEDVSPPISKTIPVSLDTPTSPIDANSSYKANQETHIVVAGKTKKVKKKKLPPHPKVARSLAPEIENAYQESRKSSVSPVVESLNDLPGYTGYVLSLTLNDHSQKKIAVYVQDESIDQLKAQKIKINNLLQGPKNPQHLKKIMFEEIPQVMANLINTSKIGDTNFKNCLGHTIQDLHNTQIEITEEARKALEVALGELAKKIESTVFEVENLIDDGGSDTSIGMRHSENGEIEATPFGGARTSINLPIFIKMDKTTHELTTTNFIKVGKILWGTKQEFNSRDHSLKSLDLITSVMLKNCFLEAKVSTQKDIFNSSRSQYTLGYDFIKKGVTPFVQLVSDRYNQTYCGVTVDAYKKDCGLFSYSLLATAKMGKIIKEDSNIFGTLNAQGTINIDNGLSFTSSVKLAPKCSEIKLSIGFYQ